MPRELPRNDIPVFILAVLESGAAHGYAIAREIDRRCEGDIVLRDGALYPALRALEDDGLVIGEWQNTESGGPPRKTYRLTDAGKLEATRRAALWRGYAKNVERILGNLGGQSEPA
jgi:PadR family transcriptional regulator, regulatory protein PadR